MKTLFYKLLVFIIAFPIGVFANTDGKLKGKYTKEKTITKEFTVAPDALLKVSNSYGMIHMTSWDKNTVAIEVTVKTNGNSEDKVAERLQQINIDFNHTNAMVNATTNFSKNNQKSWFKWTKSNKVQVIVNYTIKFPKNNELHISNDYGGIFINRAENSVTLNCDYGRLEAGELNGKNNNLNFDYTNNVTIAYMNSGNINADYSSFTINKAGNIQLNADHTKSRFGTIGNILYSCDYNLLEIEEANNVVGAGDYLSLRLGKITGNLDLTADYGSIKIAEMTKDAGNIRIISELAGIKIGYDANYSFNFDINVEYTSLKGIEDFYIIQKRIEVKEGYFQGYQGNSSAKNNLKINSEYGSIRFEKL